MADKLPPDMLGDRSDRLKEMRDLLADLPRRLAGVLGEQRQRDANKITTQDERRRPAGERGGFRESLARVGGKAPWEEGLPGALISGVQELVAALTTRKTTEATAGEPLTGKQIGRIADSFPELPKRGGPGGAPPPLLPANAQIEAWRAAQRPKPLDLPTLTDIRPRGTIPLAQDEATEQVPGLLPPGATPGGKRDEFPVIPSLAPLKKWTPQEQIWREEVAPTTLRPPVLPPAAELKPLGEIPLPAPIPKTAPTPTPGSLPLKPIMPPPADDHPAAVVMPRREPAPLPPGKFSLPSISGMLEDSRKRWHEGPKGKTAPEPLKAWQWQNPTVLAPGLGAASRPHLRSPDMPGLPGAASAPVMQQAGGGPAAGGDDLADVIAVLKENVEETKKIGTALSRQDKTGASEGGKWQAAVNVARDKPKDSIAAAGAAQVTRKTMMDRVIEERNMGAT